MQSRFLHYRDTNYIYGTRLDFFVWLDSGHVKTWQNTVLHTLSKDQLETLEALIAKTPWHARTEADKPQCCDVPYRVIDYGDDKVVSLDDAEELAEELRMIWDQTRFPPSMMRSSTSMKKK